MQTTVGIVVYLRDRTQPPDGLTNLIGQFESEFRSKTDTAPGIFGLFDAVFGTYNAQVTGIILGRPGLPWRPFPFYMPAYTPAVLGHSTP